VIGCQRSDRIFVWRDCPQAVLCAYGIGYVGPLKLNGPALHSARLIKIRVDWTGSIVTSVFASELIWV
jgi:hypothetical protein